MKDKDNTMMKFFELVVIQQIQTLLELHFKITNILLSILDKDQNRLVAVERIVGKNVEINLNRLVKEVIDSIVPPDHIRILIEDELPVIIGDKIRIAQVFQNLLSNAIEFMDKPDGSIAINCADEGSYWRFSVSDNGPGIDAKYHEKIFQIFQTLEPRDVRESNGVGLALMKKNYRILWRKNLGRIAKWKRQCLLICLAKKESR